MKLADRIYIFAGLLLGSRGVAKAKELQVDGEKFGEQAVAK